MVICLERRADLHIAQLMPLPLIVSCFSKIQTGFTFWYQLTLQCFDTYIVFGEAKVIWSFAWLIYLIVDFAYN